MSQTTALRDPVTLGLPNMLHNVLSNVAVQWWFIVYASFKEKLISITYITFLSNLFLLEISSHLFGKTSLS